ncbi:unnamed protein product [Nippostrongylus brasiliensis]|uniref:Degenerin-like protein asic-1 (inferred by orthology to a C. elegans protein) n=1 Tax=Nippostrongylus brasiliensis TaxID=27835 RepID=A0A158R225_NIPBR|nr:unnamed protein product [Nippostrongylus brasiliensis]
MAEKVKRILNEDFVEFAEHTSAHGIPRAYVSAGLRRSLWLLLFLFCFCAFGYQAYLIILRFLRNDIIVGVEMRFEEIRFPAVTICNMNPYKNSLARQSSTIKNALESFESAIDRSTGADLLPKERKRRCTKSFGLNGEEECVCDGDSHTLCFAVQSTRNEASHQGAEQKSHVRIRRDKVRIYEKILSQYEGILAVYSACSCKSDLDCTAIKEKQATNTSAACLCFYNKKNDQLWPCYKQKDWQERKCSRCSSFGDCYFADDQPTAKYDCFCAVPIRMCVRIDPPEGNVTDLSERIVKFWDIMPTTTASPQQKKVQDREKAYGYTGVRDPIALKGKAMENIIFAVDQLTEEEKWSISYNKSELILKCSFNGKECKIDEEFESFLDPTYGACFTYVGSHSATMANERAGPAYGLRLEVFVNISEYLPTTEAAGVRLTVHSQLEQAFPDTLGHSAPTGFVSSFGIKLKSLTRLPAPYGDCIKQGKDGDFIYVSKAYSTEGCQRSCIQRHLATTCGCGDPRYPPFRTTKNCPVDDPVKREEDLSIEVHSSTRGNCVMNVCLKLLLTMKTCCSVYSLFLGECLKREIQYAMRHPKTAGCKCRQPCSFSSKLRQQFHLQQNLQLYHIYSQDVYSVSYSASRWPAVPGDQSGCPMGMAPHHCLMYKR